eukprot:TRINITY_DN19805_c0_g1::TRINITY_DN19805_c0_g1_i1::g.11300::m.11300 TRINITY_DN19805_c0_g1::TRINITY_DN19805_c0_g1_i1::g.11300  ORF type:complete len:238 (+),score=65.69,DUF829/PF05705.9/4.2e-19 TRINITY_DN19805_c0_g1_i1:81-794(+)
MVHINHAHKKALLIGWFGCQEKYLTRYVELYKRLGYDAKTHIFSIPDAITFTGWLKTREKAPFKGQKFDVVQTFSGGVFPFFNGTHSHNFDLGQKVHVFDSGPYFPTPTQLTNYMSALMPPHGRTFFKRTGAQAMLNAMISNYWAVEIKKCKMDYSWKQAHNEYIEAFSCERPKLLINDPRDNFIVQEDLKHFVSVLKHKGRKYHEHHFHSPHVQHFRFHPKEYEDVLADFLKKNMH